MIIKFNQRNSLHQTQSRQDTPHRDQAEGRLSEATEELEGNMEEHSDTAEEGPSHGNTWKTGCQTARPWARVS